LALIIKGGDFFVAAAIRLAEFLRMPRVVIGSTLVSLATTTPELVVSIMAGLRGEAGSGGGQCRWLVYLQHRTDSRRHREHQTGGRALSCVAAAVVRHVGVWNSPVADDAGFVFVAGARRHF
jgi:hypothetical protein